MEKTTKLTDTPSLGVKTSTFASKRVLPPGAKKEKGASQRGASDLEGLPLWTTEDLAIYGHLVVPMNFKASKLSSKIKGWPEVKNDMERALKCVYPAWASPKRFAEQLELYRQGKSVIHFLGPCGLLYAEQVDGHQSVRLVVVADKGCGTLLWTEDGRYLPVLRQVASPPSTFSAGEASPAGRVSARVDPEVKQETACVRGGQLDDQNTTEFGPKTPGYVLARSLTPECGLLSWMCDVARAQSLATDAIAPCALWAQRAEVPMSDLFSDIWGKEALGHQPGCWPGIRMIQEPLVVDFEPLFSETMGPEWPEHGWAVVMRPSLQPYQQEEEEWEWVGREALSNAEEWADPWVQVEDPFFDEPEDVSSDFVLSGDTHEFEDVPVVLYLDDFVAIFNGKEGDSDCAESVTVPFDYQPIQDIPLHLAYGKEAPPCTRACSGAVWAGGETEEASTVPLIETASLHWYTLFRAWLQRWRGVMVESRVESLKQVSLRHGMRIYYRRRQEHLLPGPQTGGGAIPLDEIQYIVADMATFSVTGISDYHTVDGREYQIGVLELRSVGCTGFMAAFARRVWEKLRLNSYTFSRVAIKPRDDPKLELSLLADLPTSSAKVRAMYNLVVPAMDDVDVGIIRDVRSEHLPLKELMDFEPARIAQQVAATRRVVENLSGRKTAFSLR